MYGVCVYYKSFKGISTLESGLCKRYFMTACSKRNRSIRILYDKGSEPLCIADFMIGD